MKIQVGQVKYKGRDDYRVVYGTTDAGKIYYFLDDTALKNGNRIASTELVEAIDNTFKPSHIGIVDESGNEVIPFVNKTVKLISDGILLVEKVEPESDAVKQAISLRNNPTAATKLVSTPAAIKSKISAVMSNEGRYVFNDLFSEAYICDLNAKPLVDGLYSFIAIDHVNNKIYLSKNNPDEAISEFSIMPTQVNNTAVSDNNTIDVTSVNVSSDAVENALGNTQVNNTEAVQAVATDSIPAAPIVNENVATSDSVVNNTVENTVPSGNGLDASTSQSNVYTPSPIATDEVIPPVLPDDLISETQDTNQVAQEEIVTDEAALPVDAVNDVENTTPATSDSTGDVVSSNDENMNSADNGSSFFDSLSSLDTTPVSDEKSDEIESSESNEIVEEESEKPVEENTDDVKDDSLATEDVVNESVSQENNDQEINSALVDINEESENKEENSEEEVAAIDDVDTINENDLSNDEAVSSEEISETEEVSDSDKVVDDSASLDSQDEDEIKLNIGETSPIEEVEGEKQEEKEEVTQSESVDEVDNSDEKEIEETPVAEAEHDEIVTDDGALEEVVAEPVEEIDPGYTYKDLGRETESDIYKESIPSYSDSRISDYSKEVNKFDKLIDNDYSNYGNLSSVKADRIDTRDDYFDIPPMAIQSERQDNIMEAVAKSMTELMRQNREQKVTIIQYHERLKRTESLKNSIAEKAKEQADLIKALSGKVRSLENTITKFETKSQLLESKVQDQDRIIAAQDRELKNLRPQVEGKEELAKLLKDARVLLNDSSENYEYEDSSYYGRRAA